MMSSRRGTAAASSLTTQGFSAWNEVYKIGEEEEKEEEDEEGSVEGLVRKSNGFLPMNFSNPKEESFDAEEIGHGEGGR